MDIPTYTTGEFGGKPGKVSLIGRLQRHRRGRRANGCLPTHQLLIPEDARIIQRSDHACAGLRLDWPLVMHIWKAPLFEGRAALAFVSFPTWG